MTLLSSLTNTELQSKNDIVNKLIDASIASNRNNGKTDINVLKHDIKKITKTKIIMKIMITNHQIMQLKITFKI